MLLQRIITSNITENNQDMFFRGGSLSNGQLGSLKKGQSVSFDTYFNSFSYTKYRDYTRVDNVKCTVIFSGSILLQMCCFDGKDNIITEVKSDNGKAEFFCDFKELPECGYIFPKITALENSEIIDICYSSDVISDELNCCIAICTFKREQYVIRNIQALKASAFSHLKRVFIIDNGNTLDAQKLSDDFINVLPNRNYGGSGGFTRGLIEAYDGDFSHVIFMDDDISFMPETIEAMTSFMSVLLEEYKKSWFSAAMLNLDPGKPYIQYEMGADWSGRAVISHKKNVDVRSKAVLLDNLDNNDVRYGAWWCLCMPVSVVNEYKLPYPFFIKIDDVEYGLRRNSDIPIITMNGIAVYHESFDKKVSLALEYYTIRNELVAGCVHGCNTFMAMNLLLRSVVKHMLYYRYDNIPLILKAVNDFLKGPDFFLECDEEKLNGQISALAPKLTSLNDIPGWGEHLLNDEPVKGKITLPMIITLGGNLIPSVFLRSEPYAVPLSKTSVSDTFMRKAVIQYQIGGNTGILLKRSFKKFLKYCFVLIGYSFRLLFSYGSTAKEYLSRKDEITSLSFWKKHLGIN